MQGNGGVAPHIPNLSIIEVSGLFQDTIQLFNPQCHIDIRLDLPESLFPMFWRREKIVQPLAQSLYRLS